MMTEPKVSLRPRSRSQLFFILVRLKVLSICELRLQAVCLIIGCIYKDVPEVDGIDSFETLLTSVVHVSDEHGHIDNLQFKCTS